METASKHEYPAGRITPEAKKKGTLFVWCQTGEKDIFKNQIYDETIYVQRIKTRRMQDKTRKYYFSIITEINGKRMARTDYLQPNFRENMSVGDLEMFLGTRKSKIGLLDLGYKIPMELVLERVFPHAKPLYAEFSPLDAILELHSNHGFKIPEEYKRYLASYDKEDKL